MFSYASSFNQSLETWDVSEAKYMEFMLSNSGLSRSNYDATLTNWAALPSLQNGVHLYAKGISYCASETARQTLVDTYRWVITDDGKNCL